MLHPVILLALLIHRHFLPIWGRNQVGPRGDTTVSQRAGKKLLQNYGNNFGKRCLRLAVLSEDKSLKVEENIENF